MTPQPSARAAGSCTQAYARRRRREGQSWRPHSAQCPACLSCDWCNQRPRTGLDYGVVTRFEEPPPFVDGVESREPPHPTGSAAQVRGQRASAFPSRCSPLLGPAPCGRGPRWRTIRSDSL